MKLDRQHKTIALERPSRKSRAGQSVSRIEVAGLPKTQSVLKKKKPRMSQRDSLYEPGQELACLR
jgi:hypothetical protein